MAEKLQFPVQNGDQSEVVPTFDETQSSISKWHRETFGRCDSTLDLAFRLFDELVELLRSLGASPGDVERGLMDCFAEVEDGLREVSTVARVPRQADGLAEVSILIHLLASQIGVNLKAAVNKRMMLHRVRRWRVTASGGGPHIKEDSP